MSRRDLLKGGGALVVSFAFGALVPRRQPRQQPFPQLRAPDAEGAVGAAHGRFVFGSGFLRLDDPDHEPIFLDEITGGFLWTPAEHRFLISSLTFIMALLVAQTRVEAGVHSTLEVAYGGVLGALITLALFQVFA